MQIDVIKLILNGSVIYIVQSIPYLLATTLSEWTSGCPVEGCHLIELFLKLILLHYISVVDIMPHTLIKYSCKTHLKTLIFDNICTSFITGI